MQGQSCEKVVFTIAGVIFNIHRIIFGNLVITGGYYFFFIVGIGLLLFHFIIDFKSGMTSLKYTKLPHFFVGTMNRLVLFVLLQCLLYLVLFFHHIPIYIEGLILFIFFLPLFYLFSLRWLLEETENYEQTTRIMSRANGPAAATECQRLINSRRQLLLIVHLVSAMTFIISVYMKHGIGLSTTIDILNDL